MEHAVREMGCFVAIREVNRMFMVACRDADATHAVNVSQHGLEQLHLHPSAFHISDSAGVLGIPVTF